MFLPVPVLCVQAVGLSLSSTLASATPGRARGWPWPVPWCATGATGRGPVDGQVPNGRRSCPRPGSRPCRNTNPIAQNDTDFSEWRGCPGKCRSRGVESNSDPRTLPSRGREPPPAATSRGEEVTQVSATAPACAREALDTVRAGLGYLATADANQLPAAVQAECLRELEQHDAIATAARAS